VIPPHSETVEIDTGTGLAVVDTFRKFGIANKRTTNGIKRTAWVKKVGEATGAENLQLKWVVPDGV